MHILDTPRACAYVRPGGMVCGKPALHSIDGEPICTMCEIERARRQRSVTRWIDAADARRDRFGAISQATAAPQAIDVWEPAERRGLRGPGAE
jgi:hypothetical protein